ncbi:MAG: hypothetical protein J5I94_20555, partial [Phaeodactylibacter sp.]|nr:hypothetical protein [Phaeodactylibacter sp.]
YFRFLCLLGFLAILFGAKPPGRSPPFPIGLCHLFGIYVIGPYRSFCRLTIEVALSPKQVEKLAKNL